MTYLNTINTTIQGPIATATSAYGLRNIITGAGAVPSVFTTTSSTPTVITTTAAH
jgi:polysaccharide export outer membrane protein